MQKKIEKKFFCLWIVASELACVKCPHRGQ